MRTDSTERKVLAQPGFPHKDRRKSLKNAIFCLIFFAKLALKFKYTANTRFLKIIVTKKENETHVEVPFSAQQKYL